jgi:hypothetical protein
LPTVTTAVGACAEGAVDEGGAVAGPSFLPQDAIANTIADTTTIEIIFIG